MNRSSYGPDGNEELSRLAIVGFGWRGGVDVFHYRAPVHKDAATEFQVPPVQPEDHETICRHRHGMFEVSGRTDEAVAPMTDHFRLRLEPRLADGRCFGWLILADAEVIAGVGMMVLDWPPHPSHPDQGARGYVLNVYVESTYRRCGLGKRLRDLCRLEAMRRGLTYTVLHATQQGRGLYEQLGWRPTTEMSLTLDGQNGANRVDG